MAVLINLNSPLISGLSLCVVLDQSTRSGLRMQCQKGMTAYCLSVANTAMTTSVTLLRAASCVTKDGQCGETTWQTQARTCQGPAVQFSIDEYHKIPEVIDKFVKVIEGVGFNPMKGF